jgi:hypothetical protein
MKQKLNNVALILGAGLLGALVTRYMAPTPVSAQNQRLRRWKSERKVSRSLTRRTKMSVPLHSSRYPLRLSENQGFPVRLVLSFASS